MAVGTVRVKNWQTTYRAFGRINRRLPLELRLELRKLAEPVAEEIRGIAAGKGWGARTVSGVAAGTRGATAVVRQRQPKTTGHHPEFGAKQMREAFIPGVQRHGPEIERDVSDMLGRLISQSGLGRGGIL